MRRIGTAVRAATGLLAACCVASTVAVPASASSVGSGVLAGTLEYAPPTLFTCGAVVPLQLDASGVGTAAGFFHDEYTGISWTFTASGNSACGTQLLSTGFETGKLAAASSLTGSTFECAALTGGFLAANGAFVLDLHGDCLLNGSDLGDLTVAVSGSQLDGPVFAGTVVLEG